MSDALSRWLWSQTSVGQFDAAVSVASPSVELRSWLHDGSWGRRQRIPKLADDGFRQTEDVLYHVSLTFLREATARLRHASTAAWAGS